MTSLFGVGEEMSRQQAEKTAADTSKWFSTRQEAAEKACGPANKTATSVGAALNIMAAKNGKTPGGLW